MSYHSGINSALDTISELPSEQNDASNYKLTSSYPKRYEAIHLPHCLKCRE